MSTMLRGSALTPGGVMKVGIPREVKNNEYRVAITPAGVHELVVHGHEVFVERDAGRRLVHPRRRTTSPPVPRSSTGRRRLGDRRPDPQGQGADRRGVPPDARGPGPLHLPAPRRRQAAHRGARRAQGHRHRVRDRGAARPLAAAAGPDVRGRRPAGPAGRRLPPHAGPGRPRRPHGRRLAASTPRRSWSSAPASPA